MTGPLLIAVDVETTGFRAMSDRIVEVGAVKFRADGTIGAAFSSLVNPGRPCHPKAFAAHGIPDEWLAAAPSQLRVLADLAEFLGRDHATTLVGHNLHFDKAFLLAGFGREGVPVPPCLFNPVDTLPMAKKAWPRLGSYKLDDLAGLMGHGLDQPHRAYPDACRAMKLYLDLAAGRVPSRNALLERHILKRAAEKAGQGIGA